MTARDLLRIVREGWLIILATTIVFAAAGYAYAATRTPSFESTSTVLVSACAPVPGVPDGCDPDGSASLAAQRASVYATFASNEELLYRALTHSEADASSDDLSGSVSLAQIDGTPLIRITATAVTADEAVDFADAVAEALSDLVEQSAVDEVSPVSVELIGEATPATNTAANPLRTLALALILGVLAGSGLATLRWYFDSRIRDGHDAEGASGIEMLATIPATGSNADTFHRLRSIVTSRLEEITPSSPIIAVVTPGSSDATSSVAEGLAASLVATKKNVALLSLSGTTVEDGGVANLHDAISGDVAGSALVASQRASRPMRFSYGGEPHDAAAVLGTAEFETTLSSIRDSADLVLFHAGGDAEGSTIAESARHADAVLIVVEAGVTRRPGLAASLRTLELVGAPVLGLVTISARR